MKNINFKIICHIPVDKSAMNNLSIKVAEIHSEAVLNHLNRLNIKNQDKEKILQDIIAISA